MNIHSSVLRCHASATPSHSAWRAVSPRRRARSAAATRPAISDAVVDGEKPPVSSQRSCGVDGPSRTSASAASRTPSQISGSVLPSCHASTIGNAVSSSWTLRWSGSPLTREFCGNVPSGCC